MTYTKKTKIVCTLGPASDSVEKIIELIEAGMNIARLNFSHGTYEHHSKIIENIHKAEQKTSTRIGILQDLQGPKIRIGETKTLEFKKGEIISFPLRISDIIKDTKIGDKVLVNDGLIELEIVSKTNTELSCKAKTEGSISKGNGVHFPDSNISIETITEKDKQDLEFGLSKNVDYIALSFVKNKEDIQNLRKMIKAKGKSTPIISKIERHEAVTNLKSIIKESDGLMVARGDLGVDMPAEQVPIIQKRMITLANKEGKPVITATQVLQSMVTEPRATRAEISDAANAVFDHTDAIMLSNETAVGLYAKESTQTLTKVSKAIELETSKHPELLESIHLHKKLSSTNASCLNACELAQDTNADFLINYTQDGYTSKQLAKYRPYTEIITITNNEKTARELTLVWGLNKIFIHSLNKKNEQDKSSDLKNNSNSKTQEKQNLQINSHTQSKENIKEEIIKFLKEKNIIKTGNKIVLIYNASKEEIISSFQV